mgnify:CR=1 FL=1
MSEYSLPKRVYEEDTAISADRSIESGRSRPPERLKHRKIWDRAARALTSAALATTLSFGIEQVRGPLDTVHARASQSEPVAEAVEDMRQDFIENSTDKDGAWSEHFAAGGIFEGASQAVRRSAQAVAQSKNLPKDLFNSKQLRAKKTEDGTVQMTKQDSTTIHGGELRGVEITVIYTVTAPPGGSEPKASGATEAGIHGSYSEAGINADCSNVTTVTIEKGVDRAASDKYVISKENQNSVYQVMKIDGKGVISSRVRINGPNFAAHPEAKRNANDMIREMNNAVAAIGKGFPEPGVNE